MRQTCHPTTGWEEAIGATMGTRLPCSGATGRSTTCTPSDNSVHTTKKCASVRQGRPPLSIERETSSIHPARIADDGQRLGTPAASATPLHVTSPELQLFLEMGQRRIREADRVLASSKCTPIMSTHATTILSMTSAGTSSGGGMDLTNWTVMNNHPSGFVVQTSPQATQAPEAHEEPSPMVEVSPASDVEA